MIRARFEFKATDCWVGAYWRTEYYDVDNRTDLWLCLLPMLPLRVTWVRNRRMTRRGRRQYEQARDRSIADWRKRMGLDE